MTKKTCFAYLPQKARKVYKLDLFRVTCRVSFYQCCTFPSFLAMDTLLKHCFPNNSLIQSFVDALWGPVRMLVNSFKMNCSIFQQQYRLFQRDFLKMAIWQLDFIDRYFTAVFSFQNSPSLLTGNNRRFVSTVIENVFAPIQRKNIYPPLTPQQNLIFNKSSVHVSVYWWKS